MKTTSRIPLIIEHGLVGAAIVAHAALCVRHGEDPVGFAREWEAGQEVWLCLIIKVTMMAVVASLLDLLGRGFASVTSGIGGTASPRKVAAIRIAVIAVHVAAVAIAMALAPRTFPCASVWKGVCFFGAMFAPLILAIADCRTSAA